MGFVYRVGADQQINTLVRVLREASEREVFFVVSQEARVLRNPVNLRLLRFYAQQEAKELVLVTRDVVIRRIATETGIPVAEAAPVQDEPQPIATMDRAPLATAVVTRPWAPRLWHLLLIPVFFALLAGGTYLLGPRMTLAITPVREERAVEVALQLTGDELVDVEKRAPVAASLIPTGRRRVGVERARGVVVMINQDKQPLKVPPGTEVATANGVVFRTVAGVTVPGVATEYFVKVAVGLKAGQAEADVVASEPGSAGNVAQGRITTIRGSLGQRLQVVNPQATTGGEDRVQKIVTAEDLRRVQASLLQEAEAVAPGQVADEPQAGVSVIPESVRTGIEAIEIQPGLDREAETVTAKGVAVIRALGYRQSRIATLADGEFHKRVPSYLRVIGQVRRGPAQVQLTSERVVRVSLTVRGVVAGSVDPEQVREVARGKRRDEALAAVKNLPGIRSVNLTGTARRLPSWRGKLHVVIVDK